MTEHLFTYLSPLGYYTDTHPSGPRQVLQGISQELVGLEIWRRIISVYKVCEETAIETAQLYPMDILAFDEFVADALFSHAGRREKK
jgi:hypothetical protein